jgi:LPXTG-motif cell wall-anchored protein
VPKTTGVSYTVNGKKVTGGTYRAVGGSTVTVVATALPGYTLKGRKSWTHTFAKTPKCHHVASKHVHRVPPAPLANTGVPTVRILTVGIGLLLVGAACVFLSNRRRRTNG